MDLLVIMVAIVLLQDLFVMQIVLCPVWLDKCQEAKIYYFSSAWVRYRRFF